MSTSRSQEVLFEFPEYEGTTFLQNSQSFVLREITSKTPFCEVDGILFAGTWDYILGTSLVFPHTEQGFSSHPSHLVRKKLVFRKVIVLPSPNDNVEEFKSKLIVPKFTKMT
ncbi:hypothetical protein RCL1_004887 [Eukaryota sp. TZLM3-RCL]